MTKTALTLGIIMLSPSLVMGYNVSVLFDREAFIAQVQTIFAPMESLLPEGDFFDYDATAFFTGIVNGAEEHIIFIPLTQSSQSAETLKQFGKNVSWRDVDFIVFGGFYVLPPNECVGGVEAGVPYLIRLIGWDRAEVVNAEGNVITHFEAKWTRPITEPDFYLFNGPYGGWVHSNCVIVVTEDTGPG